MRKKLDLLWLLFILGSVSLAVYWTPYQIPLPRPGRYPGATPTLQLSGGRYLKIIPTCPAPGSNSYKGVYSTPQSPDMFSFNCTGSRHAKAYSGFKETTNYPQYDAEQGLLDHP